MRTIVLVVFVCVASLAAPAAAQTPAVTFTGAAPVSMDTETAGKWNKIRIVDGVKFTTISAALSDLPAEGGLVFVPAGTYAESPSITKSNVTLWMDPNAVLIPTSATTLK